MASSRSTQTVWAITQSRTLHALRESSDRVSALAAAGFAKLAADRARLSARTAPLVVAGKFDRSAIMKAAIVAAQARRSVTGEAWGVCLSAALKGTWVVAKSARLAVSH